MLPGRWVFEGDIRIAPLGLARGRALQAIHARGARGLPRGQRRANPASASAHDHRVVDNHPGPADREGRGEEAGRWLFRAWALRTVSTIGRYRGVPAYVLGVSPGTMGARNESVSVEEFLAVVKAHTLTGWEFFGASVVALRQRSWDGFLLVRAAVV